jgi:antitoxin component YwqK of YwqJK toxin-antitoxin module
MRTINGYFYMRQPVFLMAEINKGIVLAGAMVLFPGASAFPQPNDLKTEHLQNNGTRIFSTYYLDSAGQKVLHGSQLTYNELGEKESEIFFDHGRLHGTYKLWYPNLKIKMDCRYLDGELTGKCLEYYPNGGKWQERIFNFGATLSEHRVWYSDGTLQSLRTDSLIVDYFPNGRIERKAQIKAGVLDGQTIRWHTDGKIREVRRYKQGELHGLTRSYYPNGRVESEFNYSMNTMVSQKHWNQRGRLVETPNDEKGARDSISFVPTAPF